jgi:hypothetical protein
MLVISALVFCASSSSETLKKYLVQKSDSDICMGTALNKMYQTCYIELISEAGGPTDWRFDLHAQFGQNYLEKLGSEFSWLH